MNPRLTSAALLLALLLPAAPGVAHADVFTLTFERAIPAPDGNTFAIDVAGDGTLWCHGLDTYTFYQLNPANGAVLRSFPGNGHVLLGIAVGGGTIYGAEEPAISRFDVASGSPLSSLTGPVTGGSRGIAFVGGRLYVSGVLAGFPGQVRIGRVDPATGALLSSCAPPGLIDSEVLGRIGPFACYVVTTFPSGSDVTLRIVDADTGALIEDHLLFSGSDVYYSAVSSTTELFVTRRDLHQIWVYSLESPVGVKRSTWGSIHALYR